MDQEGYGRGVKKDIKGRRRSFFSFRRWSYGYSLQVGNERRNQLFLASEAQREVILAKKISFGINIVAHVGRYDIWR